MNTFCRIYKYGCVVLAMAACLVLVSCGEASLDYNHPDVELFVKQLRTGKYSAQSPEGLSNIPKFAKEDIEELLKSPFLRTSEALIEALDQELRQLTI